MNKFHILQSILTDLKRKKAFDRVIALRTSGLSPKAVTQVQAVQTFYNLIF